MGKKKPKTLAQLAAQLEYEWYAHPRPPPVRRGVERPPATPETDLRDLVDLIRGELDHADFESRGNHHAGRVVALPDVPDPQSPRRGPPGPAPGATGELQAPAS